MRLRIRNLAGLFTGMGFVEKRGRCPEPEDCGFMPGPCDLVCCGATETVVSIEPTGNWQRGPEEEELDATGKVATAGFVDSHTHALHGGQRAPEYFQRWAGATYREMSDAGGGIHQTVAQTQAEPDDRLAAALASRLEHMLAHGSLVVEVKSGYGGSATGELRLLRILQHVRARIPAPTIFPTFLGLHALPQGSEDGAYCQSMVDAVPAVAAKKLAEAVDAFPERGFFSLDAAVQFGRAGAASGLRLKVHAEEMTDLGASAAFIRRGALSVDHLEHIGPDAVDLLARHDTVATLLPATSLFLGIPYADARRLLEGGARVALATDFNPGSAPSADFQLVNLLAASQMRMTAAEILCACTYNGAAALGLEASHGAIVPGCLANVLIWAPAGRLRNRPLDAWEEVIVRRLLPETVIHHGSVAAGPHCVGSHARVLANT